ncbi:MAG: hypothetical protein LRZ97_02100 [Candidatus Pacebacteria bacterium]|nr:hypothetical protein [Candidatus Paceibacterota bacterium]
MGIFGKFGKKIKDKAVGVAMKSQLKKMDPAQRQMFEALMHSNPDLLEKMAKESQTLIKSGESETSAMMRIGKKYQKELAEAMQAAGVNPTQMQGGAGETKGPF